MKDRIKIACDYWNIEFQEKPVEGGELCRGLCINDERKIILKKDLSDTRLMETFLHECLHAIEDAYRIGLNEHQVNVLGIALISLIRDNKINFLK